MTQHDHAVMTPCEECSYEGSISIFSFEMIPDSEADGISGFLFWVG